MKKLLLAIVSASILIGCASTQTKKYEPAIFEDGTLGAYYTVYADKWQDWKDTGQEDILLIRWITEANEYTGNCPSGFTLKDRKEQPNGDFTTTVVCK